MKNIFTPVLLAPLTFVLMVACSPSDSASTAANAVKATASAAESVASEAVKVTAAAAEPVASVVVDSASATELTIYPSAEETQPLQVGAAMPAFAVQSVEGDTVNFSAGERAKPAMIVTFRGGWCPFCNVHLTELQEIVPELTEKGMEVFFFSGDRAEVLYSGLKDDAKAVVNEKQYTIYSDANTEGASALGIAFRLPEKQLARMIDNPSGVFADGSIAKHGALSVPSVFIIGTSGNVEFVHTDPNYKVRISNNDLMQAAMSVLGQ